MPVTRTQVPNPIGGAEPAFAVVGTAGEDVYTTAAGDVSVNLKQGNDHIVIEGGLDADTFPEGTYHVMTAYGGNGNDIIDDFNDRLGTVMHGGAGNDYLNLTEGGGNIVYGEAGNDRLGSAGGGIGNALYAGPGNDEIWMGPHDLAKGGRGTDHFYLADAEQLVSFDQGHSLPGPVKRDVIHEFQPGEDVIDPAGFVDVELSFVGDLAGPNAVGEKEVGFFTQGDDLVATWRIFGQRQAVELDGLAGQTLTESDFWL